jgi:hypothetical protein
MSTAGTDPDVCATDFTTAAGNNGAAVANDLGTCMLDPTYGCIDTCQPASGGGDAAAD